MRVIICPLKNHNKLVLHNCVIYVTFAKILTKDYEKAETIDDLWSGDADVGIGSDR